MKYLSSLVLLFLVTFIHDSRAAISPAAPAPSATSIDQDYLNRALRDAVHAGQSLTVEKLIREGAQVEHRNEYGFTPLMAAALKGHVVIARFLLENGANIDFADNSDRTATYYAAANCNPPLVSLFVSKGANVNLASTHRRTPLIAAAEEHCPQAVEELLKAPAIDVNARDYWYKTALDYVSEGSVTSRFLIAAGARSNEPDFDARVRPRARSRKLIP